MHGLTLADVVGDVALNAAETHLVEMCALGEFAVFGDEVPTEGTDDNSIRAALIRHIMLDGCDDVKVHAKGVQIVGAWITGVLDLQSCEATLDLFLFRCKICEEPVLLDAWLGSVMLPGCHVPGINAQRLKVVRDIVLRQGFKSTSTVNLGGADIGGQLDCSGGKFDGAGGVALDCDAMTVGAGVFLRSDFKAAGQVNLRRAQITGQLACSGGTFDWAGGVALSCDEMTVGADVFLSEDFTVTGQVNLRGARGEGNLHCMRARFDEALDCEALHVGAGFLWQDVTQVPKVLDLTDAHVGTLRDDVGSWDGCEPVLDGFRYDRIISKMSVQQRLKWLQSAQTDTVAVSPQGRMFVAEPVPDVSAAPYTQLAGVLEVTGDRRDAAIVRYTREKRVRATQNAKWLVDAARPDAYPFQTLLARAGWLFDWVFGWMFGYGHLPIRAFYTTVVIWAACFWLYGAAYDAGQMAPNSDVVLTSVEWQAAADAGCGAEKDAGCEMPLHLWLASNTATDYETFSRGLYALDLFVPLDALGQENAWAPSKDRGDLGWWAYYLRWAVQMSGWVITAVAAAALTGVIGRKE